MECKKTIENKTITVWFSCGAASAVAAKLTLDQYGDQNNVIIINNPVLEEDKDNKRFKYDVQDWIGCEIIEAKNKDFPNASIVDVFDKQKYMSGIHGAPCTSLLKKGARYQFECTHHIDYHVLGFTYDELKRHNNFVKFERSNVIPVLIDAKISKLDCFRIIQEAGLVLPRIYSFGFPNANCIGCVKATSPTYWNLVRKTFPEVFLKRAEQSRRLGCRLVRRKNKRIFLDELLSTDKGREIKSYECGIFCNM